MRTSFLGLALALAAATPAFADEAAPPKDVTVTGSVTLISDYRFRGVSQSDKGPAIQGGITVAHKSGAYVGMWASNLAGWGQFGGANMELDLIAGYARTFGSATVDVGVTWYMYPAGSDFTDFGEPYVKVSGMVGPVKLLAGVAYAPKQQALGQWYNTGASNGTGIPDRPNAAYDNLYVWGDVSGGVPNTPITLKAHLGYSRGNPGLGPNGTSVAPTGKYFDWLVGADVAVYGPLTVGVAYVDTDITRAGSAYLLPNFSSTKNGSSISDSKVLVSITAAF
ncbi:TorF family putative porin [Novosphingobium sp. Chol11]|uniref:TorF family putative porin n=1 Tax=Novosphingobium sp. Chol11 TaxID=1385763 RepID=UPI0025FEF7E7|nr:TorF family putative porin [Novosphingobium sp. Chol11]